MKGSELEDFAKETLSEIHSQETRQDERYHQRTTTKVHLAIATSIALLVSTYFVKMTITALS